jgi:hypothetical protein
MTKLLMVTVAFMSLGVGMASADGYPIAPHASGANHVYASKDSFDWRHKRPDRQIPWYAYSESGHCFIWTLNAYHYACDPNARY